MILVAELTYSSDAVLQAGPVYRRSSRGVVASRMRPCWHMSVENPILVFRRRLDAVVLSREPRGAIAPSIGLGRAAGAPEQDASGHMLELLVTHSRQDRLW